MEVRVKAFIVALGDAPGAIVELSEAIAGKGANLTAVSILPGQPGSFGFIVDDEASARQALTAVGLTATEFDVIPMTIPNEPGALARAARELEMAGTPIKLLLTLRATRGRVVDMIAVPDPAKARLVVRGLPDDGLID